MKKIVYYLLLAFPLWGLGGFLVSCNNDDDNPPPDPVDQLPPATQTGENTFGCLINGEPFVVQNTTELTAIYQGGGIQFGGGFEDNSVDKDINFVLLDPLQTGVEYDLTNLPTHRAMIRILENEINCWYDYENTIEGTLIFSKIDQVNYVISGTFEFSTIANACEIILITEGRFDVHYIP